MTVGEPLRRDATDLERARRTETIATRRVAFAGVLVLGASSLVVGHQTSSPIRCPVLSTAVTSTSPPSALT
jgi:hypothetical protein